MLFGLILQGRVFALKTLLKLKIIMKKSKGGVISTAVSMERVLIFNLLSLLLFLKNLNADIISLVEKVNQKVTLFKKQFENSSKISSQKSQHRRYKLTKKTTHKKMILKNLKQRKQLKQ